MEKSQWALLLLYLGWFLILDTSCLSTTRSDVSCSPMITWIEAGSLTSFMQLSKVQWAAVRMWRLVMMEPPQQGFISPGDTRPTLNRYIFQKLNIQFTFSLMIIQMIHLLYQLLNTCHGNSFTSVSTPPTILVFLQTRPQSHEAVTLSVTLLLEMVVTAVVGVVAMVVVVEDARIKPDHIYCIFYWHIFKNHSM